MDKLVTTQPQAVYLPPIGDLWPAQGGIFAGLIHDPDLNLSSALIVAERDLGKHQLGTYGEDVSDATSYHNGAANTQALARAGSAIATTVGQLDVAGHKDWHIPSQAEAHLMAANLKHLMQKEYHWTSTQDSRYNAWLQSFDAGHQGHGRKDNTRLVRPVRRSVLQSFGPSHSIEPDARPAVSADVRMVTFEEMLAAYYAWERDTRLTPSRYSNRAEELNQDCDVIAARYAQTLWRRLGFTTTTD